MLPTSSAGAFINYMILLMGKTAINLNFTASIESLKLSIKKSDIKVIITSKRFIDKLESRGIKISEIFFDIEVLFLEEEQKR